MGYLKTGIAWVCLADLENLVVDMTREHTMPAHRCIVFVVKQRFSADIYDK